MEINKYHGLDYRLSKSIDCLCDLSNYCIKLLENESYSDDHEHMKLFVDDLNWFIDKLDSIRGNF